MRRNSEIYRLKSGFSPFIYKSESRLIYCLPVSSGHADLDFEFDISEKDLEILKLSQFRFKALYFILFHAAQSVFGTGHPNPRSYTPLEFENVKKNVLFKSENDLHVYIKEFLKRSNFAESYFQDFSSMVF